MALTKQLLVYLLTDKKLRWEVGVSKEKQSMVGHCIQSKILLFLKVKKYIGVIVSG